VSHSCLDSSCALSAGPFDPPDGTYWNVAGIDNSARVETGPPLPRRLRALSRDGHRLSPRTCPGPPRSPAGW
jgi:hypothetical protein